MARYYGQSGVPEPSGLWRKTKREEEGLPVVGDVWGGYMPQPRYEPAYYEMWGGLKGSRPWLDWFERMFSTYARRFRATLPTEKGYKTIEAAHERAGEIEAEWYKWLKEQTPKEEFYGQRPSQRGERPSTYVPKIRTVQY